MMDGKLLLVINVPARLGLTGRRRESSADAAKLVVGQLPALLFVDLPWSRNCLAGGGFTIAVNSPAAWAWRRPLTRVVPAKSNKASARPATNGRAGCWWNSRGTGCAFSPASQLSQWRKRSASAGKRATHRRCRARSPSGDRVVALSGLWRDSARSKAKVSAAMPS